MLKLKFFLAIVAPSAPPHISGLERVSPQSLSITWEPPPANTHNGVLRYYIINVHEEITGTLRVLNTTNTSTFYAVQFLHPDYVYVINISAATTGLGPFSPSRTIRMLEAGKNCCICEC